VGQTVDDKAAKKKKRQSGGSWPAGDAEKAPDFLSWFVEGSE